MTSINTIEDFLRVVRENDGLRSSVRREVLTEDLLALPGQFSEMLKTQNVMLAELKTLRQDSNALLEEQKSLRQDSNALRDAQNAILDDLKSLRQDSNALRQDSNALRDAQNAILDTLTTVLKEQGETRRDIGTLHGMYRRQHDDLDRFRGNYAIGAARENDFEIAQLFARIHSLRHLNVRRLTRDELAAMLNEHYDAVGALLLRERSWRTFQNPDIIAEVTGVRSTRAGFYIAIEASYTGDTEDLQRATDHARILRCATGRDAYAIVAAVRLDRYMDRVRIHENAAIYLAEFNENHALWYELPERGLEPPDLC